jgi:hypothetical protein
MIRKLVIAVGLAGMLAAATATHAAAAPAAMAATARPASVCLTNGTGCTASGTYPNPNALINSDASGVSIGITWTSTSVQSYSSGGEPLYWTAGVTYHNYGSQEDTVSCTGSWTGASYVREYMQGGSGDDGYVPAQSTTCSQNPGKVWDLPAGASLKLYATFHNVPWPGSAVSIDWGDYGQSSYVYPFGSNDTDWAGSSFCSSHYNQPALPYSNWGVTPCGQPFGANSNTQGPVDYQGVELDSVGFQCVELAARYLWFETGLTPPHPLHAKGFVAALHSEYPQYAVTGNTDTFSTSLKPGQIISMGDGTNDSADGHVGVVTAVSVSNGNGTITMMDENAGGTGKDTITVSGGRFTTTSVGVFAVYAWTENLPY